MSIHCHHDFGCEATRSLLYVSVVLSGHVEMSMTQTFTNTFGGKSVAIHLDYTARFYDKNLAQLSSYPVHYWGHMTGCLSVAARDIISWDVCVTGSGETVG